MIVMGCAHDGMTTRCRARGQVRARNMALPGPRGLNMARIGPHAHVAQASAIVALPHVRVPQRTCHAMGPPLLAAARLTRALATWRATPLAACVRDWATWSMP